MSKISLITQLAMIAIAIAIGFLYIKPTITAIKITQDSVDHYNDETQKVSTVNETLKSKVALMDGVTNTDAEELARFVPDTIDNVVVLKEIQNILDYSGLPGLTVVYKGVLATAAATPVGLNDLAGLKTTDYTVTAKVDYNQLKKLLSLIEINDYILQISDISIKPSITSTYLDVTMTLTVFNRDKGAPVIANEK